MARFTGPTALVAVAATFALFFPTSVGGVISFELGRAAMALNAGLLALMLLRYGPLDRAQMAGSLAMIGWLSALTLLTPDADVSPGTFLVFIGLAFLLSLRLIDVASPGPWLLRGINLFVAVLGIGLSLDIAIANTFTRAFYSSFYDNLLLSMVYWNHKPVLTFATHSTAGFFYYLFFWLNFRRFRATGAPSALLWVVLIVALGFNVRSTTSTILMGVAVVQLAIELMRRAPARVRGPVLVTALPALAVVAIVAGAPAKVSALVDLVKGTDKAGLQSRYSTSGLLSGNLRYLNESPLSPIGFTYGPEDLFYGDSGMVLVMVRGSLPLVVLVYVGFWRFLDRNLRRRGDVLCLFLVTCAFEVGYTPLQLFRFTSFLPFLIVTLNALPEPGDRPAPLSVSPSDPGRPEPATS
jgi:hypothetical protein